MSRVFAIVALDQENGIGKNGGIPWLIREDLELFKKLTMTHVVIMGRKTFESLKRPCGLPGRTIIVVSGTQSFNAKNVRTAKSPDEALDLAKHVADLEGCSVFVAGGAQLYEYYLDKDVIDTIAMTKIPEVADCDTFFPSISSLAWSEADTPIKRCIPYMNQHTGVKKEAVFMVYERNRKEPAK